MKSGELGQVYEDGDVIVRQGDAGTHMFVIQDGEVEILVGEGDEQRLVAVRGGGEFIGEMAIFEREPHSATVRARGRVRAISVDKKNFLRRVHHDPSLAYNLVQKMSQRIRDLSAQVAQLRGE